MKFNIKAFALASGLMYGFLLFVSAWWLIARGYSNQETLLSMVYPYFTISPMGSSAGPDLWPFRLDNHWSSVCLVV